MIARALVLLVALVVVAPSRSAAAVGFPGYLASTSAVAVRCGGSDVLLPATWYFPVEQPWTGLAWLQHGFFRTNENVASLASRMARTGMVVFSPTIPSLQAGCGFNDVTDFVPHFADLFADTRSPRSSLLASAREAAATLNVEVPALPSRVVFVGHSAGGAAVTLAAKEYISRFPSIAERLRGLVLLDPVETFAHTMAASLPYLTDVSILAISAPPSACNANTSGTELLLGLGRPFVGVEVTSGSHCDAEGASGNPVLCGFVCGPVRPLNVATLQTLAVGWARDLVSDRSTPGLYPGDRLFEALVSAGIIRAR